MKNIRISFWAGAWTALWLCLLESLGFHVPGFSGVVVCGWRFGYSNVHAIPFVIIATGIFVGMVHKRMPYLVWRDFFQIHQPGETYIFPLVLFAIGGVSTIALLINVEGFSHIEPFPFAMIVIGACQLFSHRKLENLSLLPCMMAFVSLLFRYGMLVALTYGIIMYAAFWLRWVVLESIGWLHCQIQGPTNVPPP